MVNGTKRETSEWAVHLQAAKSLDQLLGISRARLGNAGRQRLDRQITANLTQFWRFVVAVLISG
jgi:hypothetical protein